MKIVGLENLRPSSLPPAVTNRACLLWAASKINSVIDVVWNAVVYGLSFIFQIILSVDNTFKEIKENSVGLCLQRARPQARKTEGSWLAEYNIVAFPTVGDGSCAFHALLGTERGGVYCLENVEQKRKEFAQWIRGRDEMPQAIKTILTDFFYFPANIPIAYKKNGIIKRINFHKMFYKKLSNAKKDKKLEKFLKDKSVLRIYCKTIAQRSVYLSQEEIILLGEFAGKTVALIQREWNGRNTFCCNLPAPEIDENRVWIYYQGNHYERASVVHGQFDRKTPNNFDERVRCNRRHLLSETFGYGSRSSSRISSAASDAILAHGDCQQHERVSAPPLIMGSDRSSTGVNKGGEDFVLLDGTHMQKQPDSSKGGGHIGGD